MSDRRMFSKAITESDAFTELPFSSQALYLQLSMNADDEGFVNNAKRVVKVMDATDNDLLELVNKSFLIKFDSGIYVIKHWKVNNRIRADRKKETNYPEEKSLLSENSTGVYSLKTEDEVLPIKDEVAEVENKVIEGDPLINDKPIANVENEESSEDINKKLHYESVTDSHKDYAGTIFDIYFSNNLPCPKDLITFTMRDFRLALESIRGMYLSSKEVIEATENYVKVIQLAREGKSWWNQSGQTFNSFCEKKTILKFVKDNFNIEHFYKEKTGAVPASIEDKIEL